MSKKTPNRYNVSDITIQFDDYLMHKGASKVTRKNYLSDLRSFLIWNNTQENFEEFSLDRLISYKNFLEISKLPIVSINRSLSSLRAYGDLLVQNQAQFTNPARMVSNVTLKSKNNSNHLVDQFSQIHKLNTNEIEILREFLQ